MVAGCAGPCGGKEPNDLLLSKGLGVVIRVAGVEASTPATRGGNTRSSIEH
jgi:hypothetical protein